MNIRELSIILLLICFCLKELPVLSCIYKYKVPKHYDSSRENIDKSDIFYYNTRFTEILPNPVIYLYGKNTYDDPILLMVFSSTIPVEWLNGEKSSDLDSIILKLNIPPQHGYFYKILKISADQILQTVAFSTSSTLQSSLEGQGQFAPAGGGGSGSLKGRIEHTFNKSKAYDTIRPIITYSGVGSDTVNLMLKRGEEYPIPNGRINVYMMVRAIRGESGKIADIINDYYKGTDDNFYENDLRFKNELGCLVNEVSCNTYKDLYDFFDKMGINLDKAKGFQYKKINDFIKTSVFLKYKDRCELLKALLDAENKDPQILDSIQKLASHSNNPNNFLKKVNEQNYVDISYKLSKNVIDFINSIPPEYNKKNLKNASKFGKLISTNQNEIKLMNNADISSNKVNLINNVNIPSSESGKSSTCTNSDKSSSNTNQDNFNIASYDLYAEAYKLKMRISAYNYAIHKICCPSPDFDLSKYIKDDHSNVCNCQSELEKYQKIIALNKSIYLNTDSNKSVFNLELQKNALDLIDKIFNKKNKEKSNEDALFDFVKIDNLISKASNCKFCTWNELKSNPYYYRKYYKAIMLVDKIVKESAEEYQKETTCDQSLIELIKNDNNVDLRFNKAIVQNKKNTFLNFEKKYIDCWCFPLISRGILLPIGILLWPLHLPDRRIEYHPDENAITTAKILEGSRFDKDNNTLPEYIKDDDCIFEDMKNQIDQIKKEREATIVKPTIIQPQTGK